MNHNRKGFLPVVVLLCTIACGVVCSCNPRKETTPASSETAPAGSLRESPVIECDSALSNLFFHDYTVLIIGHSGCSPCDEVRKRINLPSDTHIHAFFIDREKGERHKLIAQSLRTSGFPSIYLIDRDHNIKSILKGVENLDSRLASAIRSPNETVEESIKPEDVKVVLSMLSASFDAALALNDGDYEAVYRHARRSLHHRAYFFNNWLLHTYFVEKQNKDSANYYKTEALSSTKGPDDNVYDNLIEELQTLK